jgi:hypothetical protein
MNALRMNLDVLNPIVQDIYTPGALPAEIAYVEVVYLGNAPYAVARPRRDRGRHGYSHVDVPDTEDTQTLCTAIDTAIQEAICCSWFDSSYP